MEPPATERTEPRSPDAVMVVHLRRRLAAVGLLAGIEAATLVAMLAIFWLARVTAAPPFGRSGAACGDRSARECGRSESHHSGGRQLSRRSIARIGGLAGGEL